jgi:hypothetical protein
MACPSLPIPEDTPFELPGTHDFHQQCRTDLQVATLALLAFRSPSLELWPTQVKTEPQEFLTYKCLTPEEISDAKLCAEYLKTLSKPTFEWVSSFSKPLALSKM